MRGSGSSEWPRQAEAPGKLPSCHPNSAVLKELQMASKCLPQVQSSSYEAVACARKGPQRRDLRRARFKADPIMVVQQREETVEDQREQGFCVAPTIAPVCLLGMPTQEQAPSPYSTTTPKEAMSMDEPNSSKMWKSCPQLETKTWSPAPERLKQGLARWFQEYRHLL